jgi:hypothetical protein
MMKRVLVFGLCLALVSLSYAAAQVEDSKAFSSSQNSGARAEMFAELQETPTALALPDAHGSWLIEMSRSGGMRPGKESVQINSDGEINVTSEHYANGRTVVDCSRKEKLSAEDLRQLKAALRAVKLSRWRESYDDPKHPVCCDQPTTHLTIHRREIGEGDGGGPGSVSQTTSWYPGSSELRPKDLTELAAVTQTLWNNARARCAG